MPINEGRQSNTQWQNGGRRTEEERKATEGVCVLQKCVEGQVKVNDEEEARLARLGRQREVGQRQNSQSRIASRESKLLRKYDWSAWK